MLALVTLLTLAVPQHPYVARYTPDIVLGWQHGGERVSHFEVERSIGGGAFRRIGTAARDARTFRDHTSRPGVTYLYRVRAVGVDVTSEWSDELLVRMKAPR